MTIRYDPADPELSALTRFAGGFDGKRVLEIGCGNGRITRKFASQAAHVDAIDPSEAKIEEALAQADDALAHVHYYAQSLEDWGGKRPYDLVILSWSL